MGSLKFYSGRVRLLLLRLSAVMIRASNREGSGERYRGKRNAHRSKNPGLWGFPGWLSEKEGIRSEALPYNIEKGGVFLKGAAILAGLGTIGKTTF